MAVWRTYWKGPSSALLRFSGLVEGRISKFSPIFASQYIVRGEEGENHG
jgi:hypothetical protein